jgi:DNA-binding MarR family transcriptional regulator
MFSVIFEVLPNKENWDDYLDNARCCAPSWSRSRASSTTSASGSHEPTLAELAARAGVDATTLSRSVKSLERRNLVRNHGGRGRAGKRLVLTGGGRRLMDESMAAWERARARLAEALGEEASRVAGSVMSRLAVAAQAAASAVSPTDS